jgi:hypothetical protein
VVPRRRHHRADAVLLVVGGDDGKDALHPSMIPARTGPFLRE